MEYGQPVSQFRHRARRHWVDLLIVVLVLGAILELSIRTDASGAPRITLWLALPTIAAIALTVAGRHRYPFAAPAGFWLYAAALSFVDGRLVPFPIGVFLVGMTTSFLLGNLRAVRQAWAGLAIVVGSSEIIVYNQPERAVSSFIFIPILFGISWLAGFAIHSRDAQAEAAEARAAQAEREREIAARIAVAEERARIARELHDVVAHAVSVMVLQVGAVRHRLPEELVEDSTALRDVERAGREALTEMRRLLGAMREDGHDAELAPQRGLGQLADLTDEVTRVGLPVHLHIEGDPLPLPRGIDLSAYRIVQEGLTNALKHAQATRADVTLRYRADELELEVRDDGAGPGATGGLGHGLVGMRERVKIYGGEMWAGASPGGGYSLRARLPLTGEAT